VTLSSSGGEFFAKSEALKIRLIYFLYCDISIDREISILVENDDVGVIL
jgi:hypothetical protein